jgi:hypothetical protein
MHPAPRFTLLVSCLVAGLTASAAHAGMLNRPEQQQPKQRRFHSVPPKVILQEFFVAWGPRAEDEALEKARDWLVENAHLEWTPTANYLKKNNLVHNVEPTADDRKWANQLRQNNGEDMPVVRLQLAVSPEQAEDLYKMDREQRMPARHLLLGRVLAGFLAVVLVAGGYLRLEEATRGYYTLLLRAAALAFLAMVGAGLYLTV